MSTQGTQAEPLTVYTTCPASTQSAPGQYLHRLREVSRWTESAGCRGLLVYADNTLTDVWLTAQAVIEHTERLVPLVAVQPAYMHPYTAAKAIASLAWIRDRRVDLNLVTGGFAKHLAELGDPLRDDHDGRYSRLVEYAQIIQSLLSASAPAVFRGSHFRLDKATFNPPMPPGLMPRLFVSGNSAASAAAADTLNATRLTYPKQPHDQENSWAGTAHPVGVRLGIIARSTAAQAWSIATARFPADPAGQRMHQLARRLSDSSWHAALSDYPPSPAGEPEPYWLHPFKTYKTFCPYLVGSYDDIGRLVRAYRRLGVTTIILDVPYEQEDLFHAMTVLREVGAQVCSPAAAA